MPDCGTQLYAHRFDDLLIGLLLLPGFGPYTFVLMSLDRQKSQGELSWGHVPIEKNSLWPEGKKALFGVIGSPIFGAKRCGPPSPPHELSRIYLWGGEKMCTMNGILEKQSNETQE